MEYETYAEILAEVVKFIDKMDMEELKQLLEKIKENKLKMVTLNYKKLNPNAKEPDRKTIGAAGADLFACIEEYVSIPPHCNIKIGTGLAIEIPQGYFGAIYPRSGLATKHGLRPANCIGVCDEDYRGEYIIALHNDSDTTQIVNPNDRIAQLVVQPYLPIGFNEVDELSETVRGENGFGSTGH